MSAQINKKRQDQIEWKIKMQGTDYKYKNKMQDKNEIKWLIPNLNIDLYPVFCRWVHV